MRRGLTINRRRRHVGFLVGCAAAMCAAALGNGPALAGEGVMYVDARALPGGDGASWRTAHRFLTDALAVAGDDDSAVAEIRVAQGTYVPDRSSQHSSGTGDRTATFSLVSGIALRGGYAGLVGVDPDHRDVEQFVTILSGDLAGNDGTGFQGSEENSYNVVTAIEVGAGTVLDGFTITGGNADGTLPSQHRGGGLYCTDSDLEIIHCIFTENTAVFGGGLFADGQGSVLVAKCAFQNNVAVTSGGGLYADAVLHLLASQFEGNVAVAGIGGGGVAAQGAEITDSEFVFNEAGQAAGAVANYGELLVRDCAFRWNTAPSGGGIANLHYASIAVESSTFERNHANRGGAVFDKSGLERSIDNCTFRNNAAGWDGGGIYLWHGAGMTVSGCVFEENTAEGFGGGILTRAGIAVVSCEFSENAAISGGGICVRDELNTYSPSVFADCVFEGNSARNNGGGLFLFRPIAPPDLLGEAVIKRCNFTKNIAGLRGGGVGFESFAVEVEASYVVENSARFGGALSGLYTEPKSSLMLVSSVVSSNTATDAVGGVMFVCGRIINCTIIGNDLGALSALGACASVENSIVRGNGDVQIHAHPQMPVRHSNVEGGWLGGEHIIDVDPVFVDDTFRLDPASPCIDAGGNQWVLPEMLSDLDGNPRIVDGLGDGETVVDMGAYEYQPTLLGDLNGDGIVDVSDLLILLGAWGDCPASQPCIADLNGDAAVDVQDLLILLAAWG